MTTLAQEELRLGLSNPSLGAIDLVPSRPGLDELTLAENDLKFGLWKCFNEYIREQIIHKVTAVCPCVANSSIRREKTLVYTSYRCLGCEVTFVMMTECSNCFEAKQYQPLARHVCKKDRVLVSDRYRPDIMICQTCRHKTKMSDGMVCMCLVL